MATPPGLGGLFCLRVTLAGSMESHTLQDVEKHVFIMLIISRAWLPVFVVSLRVRAPEIAASSRRSSTALTSSPPGPQRSSSRDSQTRSSLSSREGIQSFFFSCRETITRQNIL